MRRLRFELGLVRGSGVLRNVTSEVSCSREGDVRSGCAGEEVVFFSESGSVDLDDGDCFGRARLHAGGSFTVGEALVAHVTFANDAAIVRIFRDVVRALKDAVFTADTLVIEVADDAGVFLFFVCADGAAVEAFGVEAVVAGGGDGLLKSVAGFEEADVAPGFVFVEAIEGVAGDDAGFTASAFVEFDLESVLFSFVWFFERDEVLEEIGAGVAAIVFFGKTGNGGLKDRLLAEEFVDEIFVGKRIW